MFIGDILKLKKKFGIETIFFMFSNRVRIVIHSHNIRKGYCKQPGAPATAFLAPLRVE